MIKKLHFNKPQLRSLAIDAPIEYLVAGRGTGKTVGVLARKSAHRYFGTMPRGTGVILNATYTQAYSRTLKELIRGWQMLGYVMDHHFVVGKRPTEKWKKMWNWKEPFAPPLNYKYVVTWWNGAVAQIISQQMPGSANGINIDWIIGDELKLINEEKLKTELLPANRGLIPEFADNPYHHGQTYTTDMPVGTSGQWILDMAGKMDHEKINQVWEVQSVKYKLIAQAKREARKTYLLEVQKQIKILDEELNDLRKGLIFYHEATTLDNIHALGEDYIMQQLRDTTAFQFDTQILNIRPLRLEDGFYPDFDEEVCGYFAENESYFDNMQYDPFLTVLDCRKDKDLDSNAPLHFSMDYNRRIWVVTVGQYFPGKEIRAIKAMHVLYPLKLKDVVQAFCDYYIHHKRKFIYYWFDQTAVGEMHDSRMCDDVIKILRANGWIVQEMYLGKVPGFEERYRMWGDLLGNTGKYRETFRVNRENCKDLITSMNRAEAEQKKKGFGKVKKSEHDPKFPAEESTHYSDANDTWVYGILESSLKLLPETIGNGGIIVR